MSHCNQRASRSIRSSLCIAARFSSLDRLLASFFFAASTSADDAEAALDGGAGWCGFGPCSLGCKEPARSVLSVDLWELMTDALSNLLVLLAEVDAGARYIVVFNLFVLVEAPGKSVALSFFVEGGGLRMVELSFFDVEGGGLELMVVFNFFEVEDSREARAAG